MKNVKIIIISIFALTLTISCFTTSKASCTRPDNIFRVGSQTIKFLEDLTDQTYLGNCFLNIKVEDICDINQKYVLTRALISAHDNGNIHFPTISILIYPNKFLGETLEVSDTNLKFIQKETRLFKLPRFYEMNVKKSTDGLLKEIIFSEYSKLLLFKISHTKLECVR